MGVGCSWKEVVGVNADLSLRKGMNRVAEIPTLSYFLVKHFRGREAI